MAKYSNQGIKGSGDALNAIILGSTGLVGGACLSQLLASRHYANVVALTRRPLGVTGTSGSGGDGAEQSQSTGGRSVQSHDAERGQGAGGRTVQSHDAEQGQSAQPPPTPTTLHECILSYDALPQFTPPVDVQHAFCAFGTTIARAGSQEAMRYVDVDIPRMYFRRMKELGVRHVSLVSSLGANPKARSFYSQIKGELEVEVLSLGFESVDIFRPSVIGGTRKGDARPTERIVQFLLRIGPQAIRTIPATTIARAMIAGAVSAQPGRRTVLSGSMWENEPSSLNEINGI